MTEKKYWDIDHEKLYTESELKTDYEQRLKDGDIDAEIYDTFEYYLNACLTINNGSLEPVADDVWIKKLRRDVASDIACDEMAYGDVLEVLDKLDMFGNWSTYEINNRPVDVDSISEIVAQELGVWQ